MKHSMVAVSKALFRGLLIVIPVYLAILLLLKGMKSVGIWCGRSPRFSPNGFPLRTSCRCSSFLRSAPSSAPPSVLGSERGPGLARTDRLRANPWLWGHPQPHSADGGEKPREHLESGLIEIEDALVPGFIIEEFEDGRYTVFVPSIPTPFAGAVYVLDRQRVHPVDVPFTDAIRVVSRWGSGAKNLVAAMERRESVAPH